MKPYIAFKISVITLHNNILPVQIADNEAVHRDCLPRRSDYCYTHWVHT